MLSQISVFLLFAIVTVYGSVIPSDEIDQDKMKIVEEALAKNPRTVYLGHVNNKYYLMDNSQPRTWLEAKEFANTSRLTLAEVRNSAEAIFLTTLPTTLLPEGHYWMGVRQDTGPDAYVYDTAKDHLQPWITYQHSPILTCVKLYVNGNWPKALQTVDLCGNNVDGVILQI